MIELLNSYDYLISRTNNLIRTLRAYPRALNQPENEYLHLFFDKCLYTALNQLDLVIGMKCMDFSMGVNNQIEANYFSRIVAHTSFEILNDLNKLSGQDVRTFIMTNHSQALLTDMDVCIKELNSIKKENYTILKGIRNNIFGHKSENALAQTEAMLAIDNSDIYRIGDSIFKIQIRLLQAYQTLLGKI